MVTGKHKNKYNIETIVNNIMLCVVAFSSLISSRASLSSWFPIKRLLNITPKNIPDDSIK